MQSFILRLPFLLLLLVGASCASTKDQARVVRSASNAATGESAGDAYAQAKRCFEIIRAALRELGSDLSHVVRTRIFVTDMDR